MVRERPVIRCVAKEVLRCACNRMKMHAYLPV